MSALTEANREHFNAAAADYDTAPWKKLISQQVGQALLDRKDWACVHWYRDGEIGGREVKLLDYACGTGSVTKALGPLVTRVVGIDVSENMVQKYNAEAQAAGLKPEQVHAVVGDLLGEEVPEHLKAAEFYDFDVAVIGLGFHHFENPLRALQRLTERLKTGTGVLIIVDFLPFENGSAAEAGGTIKHAGFNDARLKKLHEEAKLEDFAFSIVNEPVVMELKEGTRERKMFLSRANRPPTAWGKLANWITDMQMSAAQQMRHAWPPQDGDVPDDIDHLALRSRQTRGAWPTYVFKKK